MRDPWVISSDTDADADAEIEFLAATFDAQETPGSRLFGPDGRIRHVEVELSDAVVMMSDADPRWPATPSHLRVCVAEAQTAVDRAVAVGARVVTRPTELTFGDRVARIRDHQGHLWWIHEHFEDVDGADHASLFADPSTQAAMAYIQE